MSEKITISGESRQETGKANSRSLRSSEIVPGVIYGEEKSSNIKVLEKDLKKILENPSIFSQVIDLNIDGSPFEVLLKDIQRNPRNDRPSHVDFLVVSKDTKVTVNVPLKFINEDICPALKIGGVLNIVRHEVELNCLPTAIPEKITVDLAEGKIGDSIHISAVELPDGVTPTISDRDFTIATLQSPGGGVKNEDDEAADGDSSDNTETE